MMLLAAFTLCLAFALGDYNDNHNVHFRSHRRPYPEPIRPNLRTTTEQPQQRPLIPEMAVVDKEKVAEFFNRWCKFLDAKDIDSLLKMYAEDLVHINSEIDHVAGKKEICEVFSAVINHSQGPCHSNFSLISGDYYSPYYLGHNYKSDDYGRLELAITFSDVLRLKEDGDYEIVLSNMFLIGNHNQPQHQSNGYGKAMPQSKGCGQTQEQPLERPNYKISQPLPHSIPKPKTQKLKQIPLPLNGYGKIPQQTNKDDQAPQKTNSNDQTLQQADNYEQAPQQSLHAPQRSNGYDSAS